MILNKILFSILLFSIIFSGSLFGQSNWTQTSGPKDGGGNYESVYTLGNIDGAILAGTDQGDLFKSTDFGDSWILIHSFSGYVLTIYQQVSTGNIYIGTTNGLFVTTDGGTTFSILFDKSVSIFSIVVDDFGYIYIGTELYGIYRSTDNGNNWNLMWNSEDIPTSMVFNSMGDLFVGTASNGIVKSTDSGQHWDFVGFPSESVWSVIVDNNDNIYAGIIADGIYKSTDNGNTWDNIGSINVNSVTTNILKNSKGFLYVVNDYNVIYESRDEGQNWTNLTEGLNNNDIDYILLDTKGYLYIGTYVEGIFKSIKSTYPPLLKNTIITSSTMCAGVNLDVEFTFEGSFESNNDFYAVLSDADGSFVNSFEIGRITSNSLTTIPSIIPADLPTGTGYRIRVRSTSPEQYAAVNDNNLTINSLSLGLTSPLNNAVNVDLKPQFSWGLNDCVTEYRLVVSKDANFSNIVINENLSTNSYTVGTDLLSNTNYWWKVAVISGIGDEVFTSTRTFKTVGSSEITHAIHLDQGWNMISTYVLASNPDMFEVFNSIINDVVIVKNGAGTTFIPSYEINNIGNWEIKDGYQIYMQNAAYIEYYRCKS